MMKIKSFVRLDFMTIKPYFAERRLLIYVAVALFVTVMTRNLAAGLGVGTMLGTLCVAYPFALGEKGNMDALYATLSVDRRTVVLGRYLFALALNVCCVVFAVALAAVGLFAAKLIHFELSADDAAYMIIAISVIFVFVQLAQLPIYFKLSYSKARLIASIPFIAIMLIFMIVNMASDVVGLQGIVRIAEFVADNRIVIAALALATLCLAVFASLRISLAVYGKREF